MHGTPPRITRFALLPILVVAVALAAVGAGLAGNGIASDWGRLAGFGPGCPPPPPTSGNTPLGSAPALGYAQAEGGPTNHSYIESVTGWPGTWGTVTISLVGPNGVNLTPQPDWTFQVFRGVAPGSVPLASYSLANATWTFGGDVPVISVDRIVLELGSTNLAGQGVTEVLVLHGTCEPPRGTIGEPLP
ncbi:MAG: hypothetical protein L3K16_08720 [Thermoplasmata archaeon]|nr:hypothetical protein [Thermoplasmata archaeon]